MAHDECWNAAPVTNRRHEARLDCEHIRDVVIVVDAASCYDASTNTVRRVSGKQTPPAICGAGVVWLMTFSPLLFAEPNHLLYPSQHSDGDILVSHYSTKCSGTAAPNNSGYFCTENA